MKNDARKQVIDKLKGEFIVSKIRKKITGDDLDIEAEFTFKGRKGTFIYTLLGNEL